MDKKGYEVNIYDDCSVEIVYNGSILKNIDNETDLQRLLNKQDMQIKEFKQIMEKHNIIGLTKLDACLADYLNVNEDTMAGKIIKQLKEEIKQLKFDCAMYKSANYLINEIGIDKAREIMFQTEKKLKQSQNSKAVEVLETLKTEVLNINKIEIKTLENGYSTLYVDRPEVIIKIDNQITKLRDVEQ